MDLPAEYRAQMVGAAASALSQELQLLHLPPQSLSRVSDLLDQIQMNAAALIAEPTLSPDPRFSNPRCEDASRGSNVIPLRRPA